MKIQLAIDRVPMQRAQEILSQAAQYVDVIEVGTSLIKDFGMESVRQIKAAYAHKTILADIKTMDEGAYEFRAAYAAGADIATVMGAAAIDTIAACRDVTREMGRDYMIDLLEVPHDKLQALKAFEDAIFCVHLPADKAGQGLEALVESAVKALRGAKRLAVAGGVGLDHLPMLSRAGFELAVVGGAITKAQDIGAMAARFHSALHGEG